MSSFGPKQTAGLRHPMRRVTVRGDQSIMLECGHAFQISKGFTAHQMRCEQCPMVDPDQVRRDAEAKRNRGRKR